MSSSSPFTSYFTSNPPPSNPSDWSYSSFTKPLPPTIRTHLRNVYVNLASMLLMSALGAYVHVTGWNILGAGWVAGLATLGFAVAFGLTPPTPINTPYRQSLLYGFAFCKGLSIGPLLQMALWVNPSQIVAALVGTALLFASFSLSVMVAGRRDAVYVGGILSSAITVLGGVSLVNLFMGSRTLFSLELYTGLLIFSLYIIYDTQLMIARAEMGSRDYLTHSMELYVDVVALFVRILIILQKREADKDRKERERNRRGERRR